MLELRPELSRFYQDLSTRFHSGLHNIRSFGHQITTRFHNDNGSTNQSPSIILAHNSSEWSDYRWFI
ncbi:hypothetical protein BLA29_002391 [Euroglyphus maynei]|uniref:Uncharacterized protein n=1 Tax=Euroglyphus maynei TaxID=6958 RepID=A0A1Y3B7V9_EURMA|nr:hypothetical protein BLA29_002391 [Euroglyphus maynei]